MARRKTKQTVTAGVRANNAGQKSKVEPAAITKELVAPAEQEVTEIDVSNEKNGKTIKPVDFLACLTAQLPDVVDKLSRSEQLALIRTLFNGIAQQLNQQEVGRLVVNHLGTFNIRKVEKVDQTGVSKATRRIVYKPKVSD